MSGIITFLAPITEPILYSFPFAVSGNVIVSSVPKYSINIIRSSFSLNRKSFSMNVSSALIIDPSLLIISSAFNAIPPLLIEFNSIIKSLALIILLMLVF